VINLEIARFLATVFPGVRRFLLFDLDAGRALADGDVEHAAPALWAAALGSASSPDWTNF
jgi:hypothetical protein